MPEYYTDLFCTGCLHITTELKKVRALRRKLTCFNNCLLLPQCIKHKLKSYLERSLSENIKSASLFSSCLTFWVFPALAVLIDALSVWRQFTTTFSSLLNPGGMLDEAKCIIFQDSCTICRNWVPEKIGILNTF